MPVYLLSSSTQWTSPMASRRVSLPPACPAVPVAARKKTTTAGSLLVSAGIGQATGHPDKAGLPQGSGWFGGQAQGLVVAVVLAWECRATLAARGVP